MSARRKSTLIVPIFIPFQGCPHHCVFCEQERITSEHRKEITKDHVIQTLKTAIASKDFDAAKEPEVAFYGGTFTQLPLEQMKALLAAVSPFLENGQFCSIRVSTRPDALDKERLNVLKDYGVRTVELGVQSMDNAVLGLSNRGHSAEDTVKAVGLLKHFGFKVGVQLMPGIPGDSRSRFYKTVTKVIGLQPDMVRLYPALVIQGTALARLYEAGDFQPLTLEDAVHICAESCIRLEHEGIPVIRMGLMSSPDLLEKGQIIAGPWHPAFGFLVRSAIYHQTIEPSLNDLACASQLRIKVAAKEIPLFRGYKNQGLKKVQVKTGADRITIEADDYLPFGQIRVESI